MSTETTEVHLPQQSAALLVRAAKAIRSAVAALPVRVQATWEADGAEIYAGPGHEWVAESLTEAPDEGIWVSAYIALMQPTVALAVAEYLEHSAPIVASYAGTRWEEQTERLAREPLAIARAVLRTPAGES